MSLRPRFDRAPDALQHDLFGLYHWSDFLDGPDDGRHSSPGDFLGRLRAAFGPFPGDVDGLCLRDLTTGSVLGARYTGHGAVLFARVDDAGDDTAEAPLRERHQTLLAEMTRLDEAEVGRDDPRHRAIDDELRGLRLAAGDLRGGPANAEATRALVALLLATEPAEWEGELLLRLYDEDGVRPTGSVRAGYKEGKAMFELLLDR